MRSRRRSKMSLWIKVQYGGLFGLSEVLARALATGELRWYRLEVAKPADITPEVRAVLLRWTDALDRISTITEAQFYT